MNIEEERLIVAEMMTRYGGSFCKALGEALYHADNNNMRRIKQAFPDYWKQYLEMGLQQPEE